MTSSHHQSSVVRCNRGFGWSFWLIMSILMAFLPIVALGAAQGEPGRGLAGLAIGGGVAALFVLTRALLLPKLAIDLGVGVLRTRRDTIPFAAVALLRFARQHKSGVWAEFVDDRGKVVARMSIADTLYAAPTAEQWAALGVMVSATATARGAGRTPDPAASTIPAAEAAAIMRAQSAWVMAGHRSAARGAPASALDRTTVPLG